MDTILKKLADDKELDWYLDMPEKEAEVYLEDILAYANDNRDSLIRFTKTIQPSLFSPLNVIYEALCKDPANWGDFLAEEHKRLFKMAETVEKPSEFTYCLDEISFMEERNMPFIDRIIRFLSTQLENPVDSLRHRAVSLLTDWIDEDSRVKYRFVINKMEERLTDTNWKIRWMTHDILIKEFGYKKEELKISWVDKTKAYFNSVFGSPYSMD